MRIRFDCTMALTMRSILHWIRYYDPTCVFYLFVDGSPSSGFEALMAYENSDGYYHWNRHLIVTYLGFGFMGLTAKIFSLLWKLFLETGPDLSLLRWKLSRIRGFCTDQGTEAGIADCRDMLPEFLQYIGSSLASICIREEFLFPLCFWCIGWHHMFDNAANDCFENLYFWPMLLKAIKAIIGILRIHYYRKVIAAQLKTNGHDERFLRHPPPSFAKWRWSTLKQVLDYYIPVNLSLRDSWTQELLRNCRKSGMNGEAVKALTSDSFADQTRVVGDIMYAIYNIRVWGSGCPCCEHLRVQGKKVKCPQNMEGKRLPEAAGRIDRFLQACNDWAAEPSEDQLCHGAPMSRELEEERRRAFERVKAQVGEQTLHIKEQPKSLALVNTADDLSRERDIFTALPPAQRHRVAAHIFVGPLSNSVDRSIASGVMEPQVIDFLAAIKKCPITEERGESGHARMSREKFRCPPGARPWKAATARLNEQLAFYDKFDPQHKDMFASEWDRWKRLGQVNLDVQNRGLGESSAALARRVYTAEGWLKQYQGDPAATAWLGGETVAHHTTCAEETKLEFIRSFLKEKKFYSINEGPSTVVFEVVWVVPKKKRSVPSSVPRHRGVCCMMLQFYYIWNPFVVFGDGIAFPVEMDVFREADARLVDIFALMEFRDLRRTFRMWSSKLSDAYGCLALYDPEIAQPKTDPRLGLLHPDVPFLLVMEELVRRGWTVHSSDDGSLAAITEPTFRTFSKSMLQRRCKIYFQVLLALAGLWAKGLVVLPHNCLVEYYRLILRSDNLAAVPLRLSAYEYAEMDGSADRIQVAPRAQDNDEDGGVFSEHDNSDDGGDIAFDMPPEPAEPEPGGGVIQMQGVVC